MRPIAFAVLVVHFLTGSGVSQDAQEAKGPPNLADLLPDETKEGVDQAIKGLSPPVERILTRAASRVAKNNREIKEANDAVIAEEKKTLEQELDRVTKAGQLEQALAIKKLLESFDEAVMLRAGQKAQNARPAPKLPKASPVGRWTWPDGGTIDLRADGSAFGSWHGEQGLWTAREDGTIRMMVMKNRHAVSATLAPDGKSMQIQGLGILRRLP